MTYADAGVAARAKARSRLILRILMEKESNGSKEF